jgi:hypothetical protein
VYYPITIDSLFLLPPIAPIFPPDWSVVKMGRKAFAGAAERRREQNRLYQQQRRAANWPVFVFARFNSLSESSADLV